MSLMDSYIIHQAKVIDYGGGRAENLLVQRRSDSRSWSWFRFWGGQIQASATGWDEKAARVFFEKAR